MEAAGRLRPGFADGVRFIELASMPSAGLVPGAIAAGLGLNSSAGRLRADLVPYLRRRLLLVLDNFEQVADAAPLLAGLLAVPPAGAARDGGTVRLGAVVLRRPIRPIAR